jgi:alpha-L-fucosidase 2
MGLCARGGFEVDMEWQGGRLTRAVIHSKNDQSCRVVYDGKTREFKTKAGEAYPLTFMADGP